MPIVNITSITKVPKKQREAITEAICISLAEHLPHESRKKKLTKDNFLVNFFKVHGNKKGLQIRITAANTPKRKHLQDEIAKKVRKDLQKAVVLSDQVRVCLLLPEFGYSRG